MVKQAAIYNFRAISCWKTINQHAGASRKLARAV